MTIMDARNRHVLKRFFLKTIILSGFALLRWREGVFRTLAVLFLLAAILNAIIAVARRDRFAWRRLSYWDEAAIFLLMSIAAAAAVALRP